MALYVVPIDAPAAGADWQTVVPGQYIWNVTGITATLDSPSVNTLVAADSSGNGHDGTYQPSASPSGFPYFTDGLVVGDEALLAVRPGGPISTQVDVIADVFDTAIGFTIAWWQVNEPAQAAGTPYAWLALNNPLTFVIEALFDFAGSGEFRFGQQTNVHWRTAPGAITPDGLTHFYALTYDGNTDTATLYVDGALVPWAHDGGMGTSSVMAEMFLGNVGGSGDIYDEWAVFDAVLSAGDVAALYAAGLAGFATWTPAVLALAPVAFYHLDDGSTGAPRQVDLLVTNGTSKVLEIPTGFAPPAPPGPYGYSWSPTLRSSTQTPTSEVIAVAIPRLILPAGYTIGTRTLDIGAADQWSDVTLWWDSSYQDRQHPIDPYAFPPGALLRFVQTGGQP